MGVSLATVLALRESGSDIVHLRELGLHRLPDDRIMAKAASEGRIVITFDLDFGELLAASGDLNPSVILFRMRNQTPAFVTPRLKHVIAACTEALAGGAVILVEDHGYRVRRLPIRPDA